MQHERVQHEIVQHEIVQHEIVQHEIVQHEIVATCLLGFSILTLFQFLIKHIQIFIQKHSFP